ncbi:MAG TPA: hypothetical protein VJQ82_05820 [Terriglobales bacterium]|nr:hypothetical protein [Terriglobales bacterium]
MSTSAFNAAGLNNVATPAATQKSATSGCCCPACLGLECLDRPRFFAGQLLTEADLNSAQSYVLAKNRLHNRYLHGYGVVCGLEVVCNNCDGYVTVKPGYAIDPCGNDIIVCQAQSFNVIGAISKCIQQQKQQQRANCQPYVPTPDPGCSDTVENYCITIAYQEQETRPVTALQQNKTQSCGCGCGGSGSSKSGGCGCGCGGGNGNGSSKSNGCGCHSSTTTAQTGTQTMGACEPTRTMETFQLSVVAEPANQCGTLAQRLENTLLYRIINCVKTVLAFLEKRTTETDRNVLVGYISGSSDSFGSASSGDLQTACCRLRQAVVDLYTNNPCNVRCSLINVLDQIRCTSSSNNQFVNNTSAYADASASTLSQLFALLLQYMLDCICCQFQPPCPADPCDDRLILACVTVKNCKIIDICNFSCRHFAGSFPAMNYWLSIIPIIPVIAFEIKRLCCMPDMVRANSPLVNSLDSFLKVVDPTGSLRKSLTAGNFALPKMYASAVQQLRSRFTLANVASSIRSQGTNLATLVGQNPDQVRTTLQASGVTVVDQVVQSADQVPALKTLTSLPFAASGDTVVIYRTQNAVLGFAPASATQQVAAKQADLEALRSQVTALQQQVEVLKKGPAPKSSS